MFFTKAGTFIAWLIFVPCAALYLSVFIAGLIGYLPELVEAIGPGFDRSNGEALKGIVIGTALGIASEISKTLAAKNS